MYSQKSMLNQLLIAIVVLKTLLGWATSASAMSEKILVVPFGENSQTISILEDGILFGERATNKDQNKFYLRGLKVNPWDGYKHLPVHYRSETVAMISVPGEDEYYHWLLQVMPQLAILKKSGLAFDKIYISQITKKFQQQALEVLGLMDQILTENPGFLIQAKKVLYPSFPKTRFPRWMQEFLHGVYLDKVESPIKNKKIYITRQSASKRRMINSEEVEGILMDRGFAEVDLGDYTVLEQAAIINQASEIISLHGSGLANLVFAKPGTKVLELSSGEGPGGPFNILAKARGLSYQVVDTRPATNDFYEGNQSLDNDTDVYIDIDLLVFSD